MKQPKQLSLITNNTQFPQQWETPPDSFSSILFERVNPERNENRFYWLAWQPTLIDDGAVVRVRGRKGGGQQVFSATPFESLVEAWPMIKATIRTRLSHGYRVVLKRQ